MLTGWNVAALRTPYKLDARLGRSPCGASVSVSGDLGNREAIACSSVKLTLGHFWSAALVEVTTRKLELEKRRLAKLDEDVGRAKMEYDDKVRQRDMQRA